MAILNKPLRQWLALNTWWQWIAAIDLFFLVWTVFLTYHPNLPVFHYLNLGGELNGAAWWSSMLLLTAALLGCQRFISTQDGSRMAWMILSAVLLVLSWDELGSLHERVGWSAYLPYGLMGATLLLFALGKLLLQPQTRWSALLIGLGFCLFGSVVLQEHLEFSINWPDSLLGIRAAVEEGSELLGMLCCLAGILHQRHPQRRDLSVMTLLPMLPYKTLQTMLLGGLPLHILVSIWVPQLGDLPDRGNSALWYPVAVYFMLLSTVLRDAWQPPYPERGVQLGIGGIAFIFSLLLGCYKYPMESLWRLHLYHFLGFFWITVFYTKRFPDARKPFIVSMTMLTVLLSFSAVWQDTVLSFTLTGFSAYCIASLYLKHTDIEGGRLPGQVDHL